MIVLRRATSHHYWVIMLDASRFDGTQNSRPFVLKLLFNRACGMTDDMLNDYSYRPLKCKSFVGVDFNLDYQCLSGEPGTTVNNSAIMETIAVGILSSLLSFDQVTMSRSDILGAVTFWGDAFQINLTTEVVEVDVDNYPDTLPFVTHCSGWFLSSRATPFTFNDILSWNHKTYESFVGQLDKSESKQEHNYIFSVLPGRFCAKTGFTLDAGEHHEKIILATMQSMMASVFHVPIVRVLVYKVIQRYKHLWTPTLMSEFGRMDEFAWRKVPTVISRASIETFGMCCARYGCTQIDLINFEKRLFDAPLPMILGGELIDKLLKVDLSL